MQETELIARYNRGQRDFAKVNLRYSKLQRVNLQEANLEEARLSWSDLRGANLSRANLCKVDFQETNLSEANLHKADLREVCFRKADLSGADLSGANLELADLTRASLTGSDLSRANLQGAKVTDKQLTEAKSLSGAIMPEGLIRFSDEGDPIVIRELEGAERGPGVKESGQAGTGSQQRSGCVFWHLERWPIAAATTAIVAAIPALFLLATFPLHAIAQRCPSWRPGSYFEAYASLIPFVVAAVAMGAGLGALTGWIGQLLAESTGNRNWRIGCGCMAVPLWGTMSVMAGWFLAIITAMVLC